MSVCGSSGFATERFNVSERATGGLGTKCCIDIIVCHIQWNGTRFGPLFNVFFCVGIIIGVVECSGVHISHASGVL